MSGDADRPPPGSKDRYGLASIAGSTRGRGASQLRRFAIRLCDADNGCRDTASVADRTARSATAIKLNQGNNARSDDQDIVTGVYLPTDRSLSRAVGRARERLADHEYHEALAFLHGILGRDEDSFLERAGDDRRQLGLKATARQLIGELPPEGHDAYELLQGPTARRQLEAALKNGDRDGIANVVRQFFHTQAGYEATLVLAQLEADQGHRLAAAQLYQELINTPRAADRFEPQLSVAAALNQLAAGRFDDAATTIKSLSERKPAAAVELFGKQATLPAAGADPLAWLTGFVGATTASAPADNNWLTLHGDPSRNIQSPGGEPHLRPRWEARVVNEPAIESFLTSRTNDFVQRGVVAIPGARPIAVGDVVVMRTPENVVAVDWQTGKRIWETRDEQELDSDDAPSDLAAGTDSEQWSTQGKPLEERMWDDALATALSSDGSRVFVVRGVSTTRDEDSIGWQFQPGFGRIGLETPSTTNQLAAYDLATQGKLAWELDGGRTAGTLAGAFFLGPPVAIDNTLFVMAEIRTSLYLLALDPATGQVEWQQQLVGLEQGIAVDPAGGGWGRRHRIPAASSFAPQEPAPPLRSMWSNANLPGSIATRAKHNRRQTPIKSLATAPNAKPTRARERPMARQLCDHCRRLRVAHAP